MSETTDEKKKSLPPQNLSEFLDAAWDLITSNAEESAPFQTLLMQGEDDFLTVIVAPWRDDMEKYMVLIQAMIHINEIKAKRYAVMAEVWVSSKALDEKVTPSQASDRKSQIFTVAVDRSGEILYRAADLDIAEDGTRKLGLPFLPPEGAQTSGILTNLFTGAARMQDPDMAAIAAMILKAKGSHKLNMDNPKDKEVLASIMGEEDDGGKPN